MEAWTYQERSENHKSEIDHSLFLHSVSCLPCALCKLPEAFGLQANILCYRHYFNMEEHLVYVGPMPDLSYYVVDQMSGWARKEFLTWYEPRKAQLFNNSFVLEAYCEDDVTVLR